jgi:hypothetical protein
MVRFGKNEALLTRIRFVRTHCFAKQRCKKATSAASAGGVRAILRKHSPWIESQQRQHNRSIKLLIKS